MFLQASRRQTLACLICGIQLTTAGAFISNNQLAIQTALHQRDIKLTVGGLASHGAAIQNRNSVSNTLQFSDRIQMRHAIIRRAKPSHEMEKMHIENGPALAEMLSLVGWISTISTILFVNYFGAKPWPEELIFHLTFSMWSLVHAICGMLFGGTIILSTLVEWLVVENRQTNVLKFWFWNVPKLDAMVVLPSLTGSVLSGVAQACYNYGSLAAAPKHVTGSIHGFVAFALWWAATDFTTQQRIKKESIEIILDESSDGKRFMLLRRVSNVISCFFVVGVYTIMVLKPWGYNPAP